MRILITCMIYLGSALMVYNIIHYYKFIRKMKTTGVLEMRKFDLYLPFFLLIFFLIGYLVTGILGDPSLVMAGILFGGSIFVFIILNVMINIIGYIQNEEDRVSAMYNELRQDLTSITKDRLAVFHVNLTKDIIVERGGTDLYDSDQTAGSYTQLIQGRFTDLLIKTSGDKPTGLFTREGLLEHFQNGHTTASEIIYSQRKSVKNGYYLMEATLVQQPNTGDIIAFITERDYNKDIIDALIWNKALSEEFDAIAYIASGQLGVALRSDGHKRQSLPLPEGQEQEYEDYIKNLITSLDLGADEPEETLLKSLKLDRVRNELSDSDFYTVDFSYHTDEGLIYKRFTFYAADRQTMFYALLISDTTEIRLEQEKQNAVLEEALKQAKASNEAKTAFLSNMSHDIRTPMNAIIGFTNLAKQSTDDPEQTGQYLEKILMSSNHLLSLINDVLEMSRIESGKIELDNSPCNLTQIMEDSAEMVRNLAESKNQDLSIDLSKLTDESIICDELRLKQILLNLLSNAVKYTPDNGRIEFSALEKDTAAPQRKIYEFHVKDNGIGMSPEFAARVFEAFEREKNSTVSGIQGTGLGMTITRKIVDMMGGTIDVDTAPGKGTEFTVVTEFEITSEDTRRPKAKPAMSTETDFSGKRLLLVDDMPTNREIAKAILRKIGFIVEEAFDGSQAVSMVEASAPGYYDAVLMDIQMPVMNGYEAAKKIRLIADQKLASIPILAMTANAFDEDRKRALEAGMNGHVAKPINIKALMDSLKEVL